jgi:hypothetical protein
MRYRSFWLVIAIDQSCFQEARFPKAVSVEPAESRIILFLLMFRQVALAVWSRVNISLDHLARPPPWTIPVTTAFSSLSIQGKPVLKNQLIFLLFCLWISRSSNPIRRKIHA